MKADGSAERAGGKAPHKNKSRAPLLPLDVRTLLLSVGGLGFLRPAPGTWGSLPPVLMVWALLLMSTPMETMRWLLVVVGVVFSAVCVVAGRYSERRFGMKDAPEVVADETAGQAVALLPLTWLMVSGRAAIEGGPIEALQTLTVDRFVLVSAATAWAFLMFRLFDTLKPPPARKLEQLPHGWGVLMDDLAAGLYAAMAVVVGFLLAQAVGLL